MFRSAGVDVVTSLGGNEAHRSYLGRVGFEYDADTARFVSTSEPRVPERSAPTHGSGRRHPVGLGSLPAMLEIDDVDACAAWVELGDDRPLAAFQSLDLRDVDGFESGSFRGCLFLACDLTPAQAGYLTTTGATVIRDDGERPYPAHRAHLYTPEEIFAGFDPAAGRGYDETRTTHGVYRHWVETGRQYPTMIDESLARRLHDHSITDALHDAIDGTRPVAIMGGHGLERSEPDVRIDRTHRPFAHPVGSADAVRRWSWRDGGHPPRRLVREPVRRRGTPGRDRRVGAAADRSTRRRGVRRRRLARSCCRRATDVAADRTVPIGTSRSASRPGCTATNRRTRSRPSIAKYFANSVREEGLLAIATHGVVFAPGSAGTIQEIFQDAAQNHYSSFGPPSPMVLLGRRLLDDERHPVWSVLESLSNGRSYRDLITITDDEDEVVEVVLAIGATSDSSAPQPDLAAGSSLPDRLGRQPLVSSAPGVVGPCEPTVLVDR